MKNEDAVIGKITKLKEKVSELRAKKSFYLGQLKEMGFDSVDDAKKELEKLEKRVERLKKRKQDLMEKIQATLDKYEDLL